MPRLNSILKLKAGFRTSSVHPRLVPRGVKSEGHNQQQVQKERGKPPGAPSFVSSFWSSTTGTAALHLKHGSDTGLKAAKALSRVFATPSVHRMFFHSSQRVIDDRDPVGCKVKRCRVLPFAVTRDPFRKASVAEFNKNIIERNGRKLDLRDDRVRGNGYCLEDRFEKGAGRDLFHELFKGELNEKNNSQVYIRGGIYGALSLPQQINCSSTVQFYLNENAFIPKMGYTLARALHDVSLAGEGVTSDRSSENENERPSDQPIKDGQSLQLLSGACNLPHPDKLKTGGEDAFFICPEQQVIGVADGVGGWADLGIDAGEYARELMSQAIIAVHQQSTGCIYPARVMEIAHSMTKCMGSSTACILALSDSVLEAANLGDSGFVVVRNSRPIFKSPVQQHEFNIPFQLESNGSDPPSAAQLFKIPVSVGDVIIVGTDGLFDNLYDSELTTLIVQAIRGGMTPQVTAHKIAKLARDRAQDKNRQTPFSTAAQDAGYRFYGGKMDDITVIVSYITNNKSVASQ